MNSKFRIFRNAQTPIFSEKVPNFLFKVFVRIVRNALSKETKKFCCIILLFFFKIYTNVFFKYFACLLCTFAAICKHYCICEWKSLKYLKINFKKNSRFLWKRASYFTLPQTLKHPFLKNGIKFMNENCRKGQGFSLL